MCALVPLYQVNASNGCRAFYSWIETADQDGFYIDHNRHAGCDFLSFFLNHTKGKMAGKPFVLAFQQFTIYNVLLGKV
jgi:hypothetical protein